MAGLVAIDILTALVVLVGFHLAFRHRLVRKLFGRSPPEAAGEPDPLASVFRIFGVMLMAFGITICVFANLIAHYAAAPHS